MRKRVLRLLVWTVLAGTLLAGVAQQSRSAAPSCTLTPQLREVAIDQGLPGYPRLVRGKETLVRPFFTLPSCADTANGANIIVKSATLAVKNGTTTLASPIATAPTLLGPVFPLITTPSGAVLPPDAAGNPIFVVPGSVLAPASTASFTASFEITVTYAGKANSTSNYTPDTTTIFTTLTGARTAITKTVETKTNALRILAVPMGGALGTDATTNLQNAMTTMSRIWPVPDGTVLPGATPGPRTGNLFGTSGGIRYSINAGLVDLTGLVDASGKFCGNGTNWSAVKSQLAQFLQTWNSANTSAQADRVSGVGDPLQTIGNDANTSCAEGMASVVSSENWFRASADKGGPTLVMETCHTFGCVPGIRSDGSYHSIYFNADFTTGDTDRGYNVTNRTYLTDDKNAMRYSSTWTNANSIFGRDDYAMMLCKLGGATTSDCTTSGVAGTSSGVAGGTTTNSFVASGTTDGTKAGTNVLESFTAATLPTPSDAASAYRLRQFNGATKVADDGVPVSLADSVHNADGTHASSTGVFSIAFPLAAGANKIQLVYAPAAGPTVVLYEANGNANAAPQISPPLTLLRATQPPTSSAATTGAHGSVASHAKLFAPVHAQLPLRALLRGPQANAVALPTGLFWSRVADGATYTVNSNADPGDGTCDETCTLRDAIVASNASTGAPDKIGFNLPVVSLTITPGAALPAITRPVLIDGTTQPTYTGTPIVELSGATVSSGATIVHGLVINASNTTVRGLVINRFSKAGDEGIDIGPSSSGDVIEGNYIGTDAAGTSALGNSYGIVVRGGNSTIGGTTVASRNLVSGNTQAGVRIEGGGSGNAVQGNYVGTNVSGTAALGNGARGVEIVDGSFNTVGGLTPEARNVISGNATNVQLAFGTAHDNVVQGNYIGTDANGTVALGGAGSGVEVVASADNNRIGGPTAQGRNVISGNGGRGVMILDSGTTGNLVDNNYIGLDATGTAKLANGVYGVQIQGAGANTVQGNAITGNASGVVIGGAGVTTAGQVIDSNAMGTNASGDTVLGQLGAGVAISNSSGSSIISNIIAGHSDIGILIDPFGGTATGNSIRYNSIKENAGIGIDLAPRGVTANDAGDADSGANNLQNYPVLSSVSPGATSTTIQGTLNSTPSTSFQLDFFSSGDCDPSGFGEGAAYLGTASVTTDTSGDVAFSHAVSTVVAPGAQVTATATTGGDTSEFSQCFTVGSAADTTPPNTGISSKPELSIDGNSSFSFASDEPGTFKCSLDDAAYSSCTSPKDYSALSNGPHVFRVYAVDSAGNADATPEMWIWGVDTVAPPSGSAFDQHNGLIDTTRSPAGIGSGGAEEALVFKAGATGTLTAVGFPLGCNSSQTVTIEIQGVTGGMPSGVDLAPATTTPGLPAWLDTGTTTTFVHGRPTFVHAMLSSPVAVTAGTQYAIVLSSPGNFCYTALATTVPATSSSFQGENVFSRNTSSPAWSASTNIAFETFVSTAAAASADLAITKADSPDPVGLGNNLTYTLTVKNNGLDAATAVQVTDTLPASVTFVSASSSQGTCSVSGAATVMCALGNLANGATATVTIVVKTTVAGSITNHATVSSSTSDPTPANDSADESTSVEPAGGGGGGTGTGTNLRQITANQSGTLCAAKNGTASGGIGVGIAFNGTNLLVSCYNDSTITVVNPANGSQVGTPYTVTGATSLGALAWDKTRNVIWACSGYSTVGQIDPTTHVFTSKFTVPGCFDGLAYDGADDTIWTSPDATSSITHSKVDGTLLSTNTVTVGSFGNSGIAVGGPNLYLANDGGQQIYTSPKNFSSAPALFASYPARLEDLECDNVTFAPQSKDAIWSVDAYDNKLNAWQIPGGTCGFGGGQPGQSISYTATDDGSSCDLRSDLFLKEPDGTLQVLAVGLIPTSCGSPAAFSFNATVGCTGCEIDARVYDGYMASALTKIANSTAAAAPLPTDPVPAINSPPPGASVLQYDPVTLDGSGWDAQDGVLAGSKLRWSSSCISIPGPGTGTSIYLSPPVNGWTPTNSCTVSLTATDSGGHAKTTSRTFAILADADHDKIPASLDVTCSGVSVDGDPLSASADYDKDGIPNGQDPDPCHAATIYNALATFLPDPLDFNSSGNPVSMMVQVPYRDLSQVDPATVAITSVNELPTNLKNIDWKLNSNDTGNAQFDRQALIAFLAANNIHNRRILITISGNSIKSVKPKWSFRGVASTYIKG
jgi:uncharacterized repeat protein (TIGR01451 family)/CSLREA domain-containing protein